jgi:Tfp pilus assembly protein PilV
MTKKINQSGQSLLEVIIALGIAVAIIISFTNATINAVRSAQYAKNQNQATKLAQETIEIVRTIRDQDRDIGSGDTWSELWTTNMSATQTNGYKGECYSLDKQNFSLAKAASTSSCDANRDQVIDEIFFRKINISDDGSILTKKTIKVEIYWLDNKGTHSAEVSTILTKWQ